MVVISGLTVFVTAFLTVALVTPLVRRVALRWKLGDKPNGRKIHTSWIPHLGGIAMVLGMVVGLGAAAAVTGGLDASVLKMIVPVGMIVALGLIDDVKNLRAPQKLIVQVVSALLLAVLGFHLLIGVPALDGATVFVILFSAFYLVGISSSVNLIDGHDGLAAGISAIAAVGFVLLALMTGADTMLIVSLALTGVCTAFLIHNFPPGKIFMGDTGSMFLGIMLGIIACSFTMLQPSPNMFLAVCFMLAIPMLDAWLAIGRRFAMRRPVFQADCLHMHHVLHSFGFSSRQTLLILYVMQAIMVAVGLLVVKGYTFPIVIGIVFLLFVYFTFFRLMVSDEGSARKRNDVSTAEFAHGSISSLEK